jgi:hypothetical protein
MEIWPAGTECKDPSYPEFKKCLKSASYHYADDSTKEWHMAHDFMDRAALIAINNRYPFWAIKRMFNEIKPLASIDDLMERLLRVAQDRSLNGAF